MKAMTNKQAAALYILKHRRWMIVEQTDGKVAFAYWRNDKLAYEPLHKETFRGLRDRGVLTEGIRAISGSTYYLYQPKRLRVADE